MGPETIQKKFASCLLETSRRAEPAAEIMSTLNYAWNVRGTLNGDFISASGTTASVDGVADVHGTAGEGSPFNHSSWIWGGMAHYGLGYMKGGHKVNPCEKYPYHMTRHWRGEDGAHIWSSHTINKKIVLVGSGFEKGSLMLWDGNKEKGNWIVRSWPQYAVAVPKGDDHIWYRSTFQFELNDGKFYSGYWEMDVHCRKKIQMPAPYVVKFWDETWDSDAYNWHFYEREEVEQSTYDKEFEGPRAVAAE